MRAQNALTPNGTDPKLLDLVTNSHWAWYEGDISRYKRGMDALWIEFYKDGTAQVSFRKHAQSWKLEGNAVTVRDAGENGDKHTFTIDLANKIGSTENKNKHIKYEKSATKPARFK